METPSKLVVNVCENLNLDPNLLETQKVINVRLFYLKKKSNKTSHVRSFEELPFHQANKHINTTRHAPLHDSHPRAVFSPRKQTNKQTKQSYFLLPH